MQPGVPLEQDTKKEGRDIDSCHMKKSKNEETDKEDGNGDQE